MMLWRLPLIAVALVAALATSAARADDLEAFFERHGLKQLLAVHLEHEIESARNDEERAAIVLRLASLYAELLEMTDDSAVREAIVERSRRLLAVAPDDAVDDLRLALLRGSYRSAEAIAENHRLRLATEEEVESARATLTEVIPKLVQLEQRLRVRAQLLERRLGRAAGSDAVLLADEVDAVKQLAARTEFLHAWALYYQSWLNDRRENAKAAERLFAGLLDPGATILEPAEVSEDIRGVESLARCILGMGLCKSLTASTPTAIAWIDLLEHEDAFEPLREQVTAWKMVVYLENGAFRQARELFEDARRRRDDVPLAWLRLAAVYGLESGEPSRDAKELIDMAVTALAGRGELDQILDLAERYGPEALGNSGFALRYVRGLMAYHEAREAHGDDEAVVRPHVAEIYERAIEALRGALAETDAPNYPEAVAESRRLVAWCLYFQGRFLEARAAFERAAEELEGEGAADALWMAIVSLDKVVSAGTATPALRTDLNDLITGFLDAYPASPHAPKLVLKRAVGEDPPTERTLQQLLAIPPGSEVYEQAQRQVADMLYRMFRAADDAGRPTLGDRYVSAAMPMFMADAERLAMLSERQSMRYAVRGRRLLEVALHEGVDRPVVARTVLEKLTIAGADGAIDLSGFADEIDYRRVRLGLVTDDFIGAATTTDAMQREHPDSPWTRAAQRAMFTAGFARWRETGSSGADDRLALDAIVRYGQDVLDELAADAEGALDTRALSVAVAVADAAMQIWQRSGDEERGRQALVLYEQMLALRPTNAMFLRAAATLAGAFGDDDAALDRWRRLVAGTAIGSDAWFEAKFNLIQLLARVDPPRARAVLEQHKQLNPDYGPEPWGGRLKGLDQTLPAAAASPDASGAGPADAPPGEVRP